MAQITLAVLTDVTCVNTLTYITSLRPDHVSIREKDKLARGIQKSNCTLEGRAGGSVC